MIPELETFAISEHEHIATDQSCGVVHAMSTGFNVNVVTCNKQFISITNKVTVYSFIFVGTNFCGFMKNNYFIGT